MKRILPVIVISQFFCTSLWFAGNSVIMELTANLGLSANFLAHITSAIQLGFITGTFVFALLTISDRLPPSVVFFLSALLAGIFNLAITRDDIGSNQILFLRFSTGFFLAGIYPVGMKIASDYYQTTLGKSLGFLVGALVLGTAFPHLLKNYISGFPWKYVLYATTFLSFIGGASMLLFVPKGPYRKSAKKIQLTTFLQGFREPNFRAVAFGYFGHMWELYAFWTFVPFILTAYASRHELTSLNISLWSFLIISIGAIACICSGILSQFIGPKKIATYALLISGVCCIVFPFFFFCKSVILFLLFLFLWGFTVIADSPLFSTLIAHHAPPESRGTALTIVNCIGFSVTIISIQITNLLLNTYHLPHIYMLLAIGPIIGLVALSSHKSEKIY